MWKLATVAAEREDSSHLDSARPSVVSQTDTSYMTEAPFYKPHGVLGYIGLGHDAFVGLVDETTVLKYYPP